MYKNNWVLVLCLLAAICFFSACMAGRDSETESLKKEVEELKKQNEDEKTAKEKADIANQKEELEKAKSEKAAETPKPKVSAPAGSTVAYCNSANVVLRDSPSLNAKKVGSLSNREKVFVIEESDNYDEWRGEEANWSYIQKENGQRGWVFSPFIRYQD